MGSTVQSLIDVSIIEILLIIAISFVGAFAHEYVSFIQKGKRITFIVWANILVTVSIDAIISVAINPMIISISPRLMLLPPLLIGMLGTELVSKMSTINGSFNVISYILGFFKITKADNTTIPDDKDNTNTPISEDKVLISNINKIKRKMELSIEAFNLNRDEDEFIGNYNQIKTVTKAIKSRIDSNPDTNMEVIVKLSESIKVEVKLDKIYEDIVTSP